jgi:hypothetical protein
LKVINSNGEERVISKTGKVIAEQNGAILNIEKKNSKNLVYNTLTTLMGKNFQVI